MSKRRSAIPNPGELSESHRAKLIERADELGPSSERETRLYAQWERFAVRHELLLSGIGLAWFWFSVSIWARWITLPDIPFVTDEMVLVFTVIYNVGWWGYIRPRIEKLKAEAQAAGEDTDNMVKADG